jgi:hypothetical protein
VKLYSALDGLGIDHTAFKVTGATVQDNPDDLA